MSLSSALSTVMAGLSTNQAALSIVSSNVANAKTPGYVARSLNQIEIAGASSDAGASVRVTGVNRQLDQYLLSQLRTETAGQALEAAGFTDVAHVVHGFEGDLDPQFKRSTLNGWRFDGLPWQQM